MLDPKIIEMLQGMADDGCSAQQVMNALRTANQIGLEKALERKARGRERQRRYWEKVKQNQQSSDSQNASVTVSDGQTPLPPYPPSPSDKEKVSIPLKEINSLSPLYPPSPDLTGLRKSSLRDHEFEQVWKIYPNRKSKKESERAFHKARKKVSLETITDALYAYIQNTDPSFLAHLATWLNQERWNDEHTHVITPFPARPLTPRQQILKHNLELENVVANGQLPRPDFVSTPNFGPAASYAGRQMEVLPALAQSVAQAVPQAGEPGYPGKAHGYGYRNGKLL